jgi:hypothetical protein
MDNSMDINEFEKLINDYKKLGNEEVTLKTDVVLSIIELAKQNEAKVALLLVQKYNLVVELQNKGVPSKKIEEILKKSIGRE